MSIDRLVAKQVTQIYAETLLYGAQSQGGLEAVLQARDELEQILAYNRSHVELTDAMCNMAYTAEDRRKLIVETFSDCEPALRSVLGVMAERGDMDMLPRLWNDFNQVIGAKLGITVVDVTTVVSLDDNLRSIIKDKAAADFGGKVELRERLDPSILGGIIMTANGKRIDASVKSQLETARSTLKKTTDGGEC